MIVGKNVTWKKREKGSNIIFPIILRLFGKNIKWGKGKRTENFRGRKSRFNKLGVGKNINK